MKRPIILSGRPFDWEAGGEASKHAVREDGSVNWRAAFSADPGVMQCKSCGVYLWREGERVRCPDCGAEWDVSHYFPGAPKKEEGL